MRVKLYRPFAHWYHGGNIFICSDPHFEDADMEWRGISANQLVKNINKKVGKNDTIVILGDVGNEEYIKAIRGYKVLIAGNHDKGRTKYEELFDEVYDGPVFISDKILLSHERIELPFAFNIHGHHHGDAGNRPNCMNVCVEHIGFTPLALDTIVNGKLNKIDSIHRITIDDATERRKKKKGDK